MVNFEGAILGAAIRLEGRVFGRPLIDCFRLFVEWTTRSFDERDSNERMIVPCKMCRIEFLFWFAVRGGGESIVFFFKLIF